MDSPRTRRLGQALLVPVLAIPALFACMCGPEGPPLPPSACSNAPATSAATEIAVGNASQAFVPAAPGGSLDRSRGFQGSDMVAFRIGVRTTESFTCLPVRLSQGLSLDRAIPVERNGEWLVTDPLFQIVNGRDFSLTASSYGLSVSGTWTVDDPATRMPDATRPDAPSYFDAPRRADANSADADSADASSADASSVDADIDANPVEPDAAP